VGASGDHWAPSQQSCEGYTLTLTMPANLLRVHREMRIHDWSASSGATFFVEQYGFAFEVPEHYLQRYGSADLVEAVDEMRALRTPSSAQYLNFTAQVLDGPCPVERPIRGSRGLALYASCVASDMVSATESYSTGTAVCKYVESVPWVWFQARHAVVYETYTETTKLCVGPGDPLGKWFYALREACKLDANAQHLRFELWLSS